MLTGDCLCGNVNWTFAPAIEGVTACNCSLCRRYGALWAYGHVNEGITVSGDTSVYMRGNKRSGFHFCSTCGCLAYYLANQANEEGKKKIAVNLRMTTEPARVADLPIDHFDGMDTFEDLPRDGKCVKDLWF